MKGIFSVLQPLILVFKTGKMECLCRMGRGDLAPKSIYFFRGHGTPCPYEFYLTSDNNITI